MLTQAEVARLFTYRDGALYWAVRRKRVKLGSRVGTQGKDGYRRLVYEGTAYLEHRLIYLLHHGELPPLLDHINGDPTDNRIENLRRATHVENNRNSVHSSTSGVKGVTWDPTRNKWRCQICVLNKNYNLGRYDTIEEAKAAMDEARARLHGAFANFNTRSNI
jgi:hypothetical protein